MPQWLKDLVGRNKAALRSSAALHAQQSIDQHLLHTVCHAARCPNRGECFNCGDATFMVLGDICTRGCRFCAVSKARPLPPDENEPERVAQAVKEWGIRYAVLTMPTRDDLKDGGAAHFARVITAIKTLTPQVKVEPLISDLRGDVSALQTVLQAGPDVLAHNVETVPDLYAAVRIGADYKRTLTLLENSKKLAPHISTKTGFMVGLGETPQEVEELMDDVRNAGCRILTIGQYLQPSHKHYPVAEYVTPAQFAIYKEMGLQKGFDQVESGPLVRSSYHADKSKMLAKKP